MTDVPEQREKNGELFAEGRSASDLLSDPPDTPKSASAPFVPPDWSCYRCTLLNPSDAPTCMACGSPQPLPAECPHCGKDYTVKALCAKDMKPHQKWRCGHCDSDNIEALVECRSCRKPRTWTCGQCSMENIMSEQRCLACDGSQQLSSLKSFVNRDMMVRAGLSLREMEAERRTVQTANEHRERLEHRLGCMTTARPVSIADDGNCLFRALAWQLLRDDTLYPLIRHLVVEHLVVHQDHYSAFVGSEGAFGKYVAGMRQAQVWGDELCVHAAGRAFPNLKIHVATSDEKRWRLLYAKVKEAPAVRNILLAYRAPNHYYTVAPVRDAAIPAYDLHELLNGLTQEAVIASHIKITLQAALPSVVVPPMLKRGAPSASSASSSSYATADRAADRPSTASRGSRSGDFLQLTLLSMQEHAVVVTVRMGSSNDMALCVGGGIHPDAVTVSQKSSFFYLHHVPREAILLAGPGGPFGQIYEDVLAEAMAPSYAASPPNNGSEVQHQRYDDRHHPPPRYATAPPISPTSASSSGAVLLPPRASVALPRPAKMRHPLFLLQEVSSGTFLGFRKSAVITFDDVQRTGGVVVRSKRQVAPLCAHHPSDLSDCLLTIAEPRSVSTNELRFYKSGAIDVPPTYICETGTPGEIVAASTPTFPTPMLVQLIFAGRCERLCIKCHQWFVTAAGERSSVVLGGCSHVSHAEGITLQLRHA